MAKDVNGVEITQDNEITVDNTQKTPGVTVEKKTDVAPIPGKPIDANESTEAPKAEDIDDAIMLLNIMDKEVGGKGEITAIPPELNDSIKFLIEKLIFVRDVWEDPLWKALLDDMADQKEDGNMPSIKVAIARSIPLEQLQELADSEDYEGEQSALTTSLDREKQAIEEDAMYEANFEKSIKAGEEYAADMGYDEARKNELFQKVMDLLKVMGDGELTKDEFADVDKMLNYGPDTESLKSQISNQDAKQVLPDKSSMDAVINKAAPAKQAVAKDGPGMSSISYEEPAYQKTGRRRFEKRN